MRSFLKLNLLTLGLTIGGMLALIVLIVVAALLPAIFNSTINSNAAIIGLNLLRWPAIFGILILALAVLYRFGPSRQNAKWRWISPGASLAAVAIVVVSVGLTWYLTNIADYNKTYGSLGAVIGLLMWMWLSACSCLIGAELNAEMERQTMKETSTERPLPIGNRGT